MKQKVNHALRYIIFFAAAASAMEKVDKRKSEWQISSWHSKVEKKDWKKQANNWIKKNYITQDDHKIRQIKMALGIAEQRLIKNNEQYEKLISKNKTVAKSVLQDCLDDLEYPAHFAIFMEDIKVDASTLDFGRALEKVEILIAIFKKQNKSIANYNDHIY